MTPSGQVVLLLLTRLTSPVNCLDLTALSSPPWVDLPQRRALQQQLSRPTAVGRKRVDYENDPQSTAERSLANRTGLQHQVEASAGRTESDKLTYEWLTRLIE